MARALLLILALLVLVAIGLVWLGVIDINQTREAQLPAGGQAPAFDVQVNPVQVGTTTKNLQVPVPTISAGGESGNAQANAQ